MISAIIKPLGFRSIVFSLLALFLFQGTIQCADEEESGVASFNAKLEAYSSWLLQNGATMNHLKFARVKGYGTTVVATKDLGVRGILRGKRGKKLAFLPTELVVTKATIEASKVATYYSEEGLTDISALWLLEQVHTPDSFWKPWINILPKKVGLTVNWSEEELKELQALPLLSMTEERKESMKTKFKRLFTEQAKSAPFPPEIAWMETVSEEEFCWALSIVLSRSFTSDRALGPNAVFVPIEDLFVQAPPTAVEPHARVRLTSNGIEFISNTNIYANSLIEKIIPSAHGMSNSELLFQYGITHPSSLNDYIMVPSLYHPKIPKAEVVKQILKAADCFQEQFRLFTGEDYEDILCVARAVVLTEAELQNPDAVRSAVGRRKASYQSEKAALEKVASMANRNLGFFTTTLEQDLELLKLDASGRKSLAPNHRKAIQARVSIKKIYSKLAKKATETMRGLKDTSTQAKGLSDVKKTSTPFTKD